MFYINVYKHSVYNCTGFLCLSSNGSDNNSGTLEAPFKTINKGISMVSAGGTVYVMDGIYQNENYGNVDPSTNTNMDNQHVVTINKSGSERRLYYFA